MEPRRHVEVGETGAAAIGVVVAGVIASVVIPGPYDFGSMMIGLLLLGVLIGYGHLPTNYRELVGFASAGGICLLLILGPLLDVPLGLSGWKEGTTIDEYAPSRSDGLASLFLWLGLAFGIYVLGWLLIHLAG